MSGFRDDVPWDVLENVWPFFSVKALQGLGMLDVSVKL